MFKTLTIVLLLLSLPGVAPERVMEIWHKNELSVKPVEKHQLSLYAGLTVLEKHHFNFSTYYALQKLKLADAMCWN